MAGFRSSPPSWGEKKRGEQEPDRELELAIGAWPSVDGFRHFDFSDVVGGPARPAHLRWAADCNPRGGPPPPTFFGPGHGSRISLRGRTLCVCTLKMVGLLSLFSIFSIFCSFGILARIP